MIDIQTPQSPGWFLRRLDDKLRERAKLAEAQLARYENRAPLPTSLRSAPDAARQFFEASRTGFAEMIVKAVKYPLRVQGIMSDADGRAGDLGDAEAQRMFRASGMAAEIDDVHRMSLVTGNGYALTSRYGGEPSYTHEDPREVVTLHDPVKQSRIVAAAKIFFHDEEARPVAYLYRPGRIWRATLGDGGRRSPNIPRISSAWDWDEHGEVGASWGAGLDDFMPVLRYRNEEGVGELERHAGLIDRVDHMVLQGMTVATLQAFKQRAIKAPLEDMPDNDEFGNPINYDDVLSADVGALWKLPETAEIWESGNVDLTPIWTGMEKFTQQLSAVTFTPLAMFSPEGQNQSAAGAGFAREGRTFKIEDRQDRLGSTHADALAQLFRLAGDESRSTPEGIEVVWRPAERYSLAEKADAMTKMAAGGVPWRTRMVEVGQFTPAQVARMESERLTDTVLFPADTAQAQAATPSPAGE